MTNEIDIIKAKNAITHVLDAFKIGHDEVTATAGHTVTLYEFKPSTGTRLTKIRNLKDEFTLELGAKSVRIIAPTEHGTVAIEVPNKTRQNISINELFFSDEYQNTNYQLPLCIGKESSGCIFTADLATMPHLLIAGATGMGKSVGLNVIISSLLNKKSPDELKLVLVDPKQVELTAYEPIAKSYLAHLKDLPPICTTVDQTKQTLSALIRLMESRYALLNQAKVRNISEYNSTQSVKMAYYVVVIDEYGDLIMQDGGQSLEKDICRLAQKARAVGIHMIISTQRPSATIVTGNIKANFPVRVAFRTTTGTDSRVILDQVGAERLAGRGDMLYYDGSAPVRVQCAYISTEDLQDMCSELAEEYSDAQETFLPEVPKLELPKHVEDKRKVLSSRMAYIIKVWIIGRDFVPMSVFDPDVSLRKALRKSDPERFSKYQFRQEEVEFLRQNGIIGEKTEKINPVINQMEEGYKVLINDMPTMKTLFFEYCLR